MQPFSQRLTEWTNEGEKVFNHLLGYVIAFTSLVAFADVLGNGQVSEHLPVLFWIWVFAQGLCVEFQVFILIKRMPGYWNSNRVMFGVYAGFIASLCLMSILIGSVFVQHDQEHGTVEQAMVSLGIPHIGFIYARAALAILLVALIAIDRAIEQHQMRSTVQPVQEDTSVALALQLKEVASAQTELTETVLQITRQLKEVQDTRHHIEHLQTIVAEVVQRVPFIEQDPIIQEVQSEPHLELVRLPEKTDIGSEVQRFIESELERGYTPTLSEIMNATGCSKGSASRYRSAALNKQPA